MFSFNKNINIKYIEEKKRFLLFVLLLVVALILSIFLLKKAFGAYQSEAKLNANIDKALYILNNEDMSFNIDFDKIVPSDKSYVYKFSLSNFNDLKICDVDLNYYISIKTTTNLPINIKLYRNENYDDSNAVNILNNKNLKQDEDKTWYNVYGPTDNYLMQFSKKTTDIYTLVVDFPKEYSNNTTYADGIEYIEVDILSKQVLE